MDSLLSKLVLPIPTASKNNPKMKEITFIISLLITVHGFSQIHDQDSTQNKEKLMIIEEPAEFPGGLRGFYDYLAKNMRYPTEAQRFGIEGRVFV